MSSYGAVLTGRPRPLHVRRSSLHTSVKLSSPLMFHYDG